MEPVRREETIDEIWSVIDRTGWRLVAGMINLLECSCDHRLGWSEMFIIPDAEKPAVSQPLPGLTLRWGAVDGREGTGLRCVYREVGPVPQLQAVTRQSLAGADLWLLLAKLRRTPLHHLQPNFASHSMRLPRPAYF